MIGASTADMQAVLGDLVDATAANCEGLRSLPGLNVVLFHPRSGVRSQTSITDRYNIHTACIMHLLRYRLSEDAPVDASCLERLQPIAEAFV